MAWPYSVPAAPEMGGSSAPAERDLEAQCRETATAASNAVSWLNANQGQVRQEHGPLVREFRRFATTARKLAGAVERPMTVGVFGASQAGKSYLISAFARHGTKPVIADFEGLPAGIDFVRYINPEGRTESTGLVTRFSIRARPAPPGYPVAVRLLSQSDVVKILGDTFFSDCDTSNETVPDAVSLAALAEKASANGPARGSSGITDEDVWDIQDYFERRFKGEPIIRALVSAGYWHTLAALAPTLSLSGRAVLFSALWGGVDPFTALFERMGSALEELGNPSDAFCPIEALVAVGAAGVSRMADSVIKVSTLEGLNGGGGETISLRSASGVSANLSRAIAAALIAELQIKLHDRPWPFLDTTDLLDFPGARSREAIPDVRAFLAKQSAAQDEALTGMAKLFLRGKVAFLFERYNAEQELTAMLLCVGPQVQEVTSLAGMVKGWIAATHGADAPARAGRDTTLFLVLTKFDAEFVRAAGDDPDSTARWTKRLTTSLLDLFGTADDWPTQWTPGHAFDNCYWLRNPNAMAEHIIDYGDDKQEIQFRSGTGWIKQWRAEFLANGAVRRHFGDPAAAWDAALTLNDGGVSYLAARLAPVCNPVLKLRQISGRLSYLRRTMVERLHRYHVSGDKAEMLKARETAARDVAWSLAACAKEERFGGLIRLLQTSDTELAEVFAALANRGELPSGTSINVSRLRSLIGLSPAENADDVRDVADAYAKAAIGHWTETVRATADNAAVRSFFHLDEKALTTVVDELIAGERRVDLRHIIADRIRSMIPAEYQGASDHVAQPALLAADAIGAYVYWLGYDAVPLAERPPKPNDGQNRVFQPRPPVQVPQLSERQESFDQIFYEDWFTAWLAFVRLNAEKNNIGAVKFDIEQNTRLGTILTSLAERPSAA